MTSRYAMLAGTFAAALLPLLVGCGSLEAEDEGAMYPQSGPGAPVGVDLSQPSPQQAVASSEGAQIDGPVMQPSQAIDPSGDPDPNGVNVGADPNSYADTDPSALTDFRDTLAPYGQWVDDQQYGTVWVPSQEAVGDDFTPYETAGHWDYDDDYTWVSDYAWGWAPFHYGRWAYMGGRGWGWVPGRQYAGAWVSWRTGGPGYGYVGWGPRPPTWYWSHGVAVGVGIVPAVPYSFCSTGNLFGPGLAGNILHGPGVVQVAGHTTPFTSGGGLNGRVSATPTVGGPSPSRLGINSAQVTHLTAQNTGVARARQFSRPSTAVAAGAHAPATNMRASSLGRASTSLGRYAAVATAPQYRGLPSQYRGSSTLHSSGTVYSRGGFGGARSYYGGSYGGARSYSYGQSRTIGGGGGAYTSHSYSAPSRSYAAPSHSFSSPSYSHSSGGGFHSGGGGGFHGGGGGHGGGHR